MEIVEGFSPFLSETSTVLGVAQYCRRAFALSEHAVPFTAETEQVSQVHLFRCRWRQFTLNVASVWLAVQLRGYVCFITLGVSFVVLVAMVNNLAESQVE